MNLKNKLKHLLNEDFKQNIYFCQNSRVCVSNPSKLIFSVSKYKVQEIYTIATRLNVDYNIRTTKMGVYKCIIDNIHETLFFRMN